MRLVAVFLALALRSLAAEPPPVTEGDFVIRDFSFTSGEHLPELKLHYRTLGRPERDAAGVVRNAVLIMHSTSGDSTQFLRPEFAGELYGPGQPLDATKYFIILRDAIGHGKSSKPSDGLRAKFPRYRYHDMVAADYRLVTEGLGVNHLRLVMGASMGGMHTWLWGELHPEFMDALMPLASLPDQIAGRNRAWRHVLTESIRQDPEWQGGNYQEQPRSLRAGAAWLYMVSSIPVLRQAEAPTRDQADAAIDAFTADYFKTGDANDLLYAVEASSDYDPKAALEKISAPLLAVNSADDLINPPELGILEREIKRVKHGRAVIIPFGPDTRGHSSHTFAKLWMAELATLLRRAPLRN
jgi:homoserine O-acetyltransferase